MHDSLPEVASAGDEGALTGQAHKLVRAPADVVERQPCKAKALDHVGPDTGQVVTHSGSILTVIVIINAVIGLLDGKILLVTGAASGVGRATCLLAADECAAGIVAADRDAARLAALEADLKAVEVPSTARRSGRRRAGADPEAVTDDVDLAVDGCPVSAVSWD